jgi:hypothetical protein
MARGRHRRRTGLLAWLWPGGCRQKEPGVAGLRAEVSWLTEELAQLWNVVAEQTGAAAAADRRTRQSEARLAAARVELTLLRSDFAALREELVWAFAERKVTAASPAPVLDLRSAKATTA